MCIAYLRAAMCFLSRKRHRRARRIHKRCSRAPRPLWLARSRIFSLTVRTPIPCRNPGPALATRAEPRGIVNDMFLAARQLLTIGQAQQVVAAAPDSYIGEHDLIIDATQPLHPRRSCRAPCFGDDQHGGIVVAAVKTPKRHDVGVKRHCSVSPENAP